MTQTTHTRETWTDACAAQFVARGIDEAEAREYAESLAGSQLEWIGSDTAEWGDPTDSANDEISYWGD